MSDFESAKVPDSMPDWCKDHVRRYLSDPESGHTHLSTSQQDQPVTALLMLAKGRKSGQAMVYPLIYGRDGDRYILVASKAGAEQHPGWYLNLMANPRVRIQVKDKRMDVVARTATGAERERLWAMMSAYFKPYNEYQGRTEREIPVVVLEPAA